METVKGDRAKYRAQYIPIDEMFTEQELQELEKAFQAVSQGEDVVNLLSLKTLFADMGFYPSDENLEELLKSCGLKDI